MYVDEANALVEYDQEEDEEIFYPDQDDYGQPRIEVFKHIDLAGRFFKPSMEYIRALDDDWCRLRFENARLKEALARSGNSYMVKDAAEWMNENSKLKRLNASLKAKLEEERALRRIETMESEHRADFYESRYKELVELNSQDQKGRDSKSGRFTSADGMGRAKKEEKALEMYERNVPYAEIGRALNISAETAKTYIRLAHERRAHEANIRGFEEKRNRLEAAGMAAGSV